MKRPPPTVDLRDVIKSIHDPLETVEDVAALTTHLDAVASTLLRTDSVRKLLPAKLLRKWDRGGADLQDLLKKLPRRIVEKDVVELLEELLEVAGHAEYNYLDSESLDRADELRGRFYEHISQVVERLSVQSEH